MRIVQSKYLFIFLEILENLEEMSLIISYEQCHNNNYPSSYGLKKIVHITFRIIMVDDKSFKI